MKTIILCEGTTDLLMIQFVLQYKYGWNYKGFVENVVTNRLLRRDLVKDDSTVEVRSCGGIMSIPNEMKKLQDQMEHATKENEIYSKIIVMIDHDSVSSNKIFLDKMNEVLGTAFCESDINTECKWCIRNLIFEDIELGLFIKCIPETDIGSIENVMLEALATDKIESDLISDSAEFIKGVAQRQERYLQKKSRIYKAIFNTYFSIRAPEEKYDERAKILKAFDWKNNEILEQKFGFLNIG